MKSTRFYYQPEPIYSTIDWCWTFVILLTGIIFWLEVTHFQWISLLFMIAFFVIAGLELFNRQLIIKKNYLIVNDLFGRQWNRFKLNNNYNDFTFTKRTVIIKQHGKSYRFCLTPKDIQHVKKMIKAVEK